MRLRIQQNNCVKKQLCSFALLKLKGRGGGLEADSEMGKQTRIWSQQTLLDHVFAAMQTSSLFLHSRDTQAGPSALLHLGWQQEYSH